MYVGSIQGALNYLVYHNCHRICPKFVGMYPYRNVHVHYQEFILL